LVLGEQWDLLGVQVEVRVEGLGEVGKNVYSWEALSLFEVVVGTGSRIGRAVRLQWLWLRHLMWMRLGYQDLLLDVVTNLPNSCWLMVEPLMKRCDSQQLCVGWGFLIRKLLRRLGD
jgi:hypothetical protein